MARLWRRTRVLNSALSVLLLAFCPTLVDSDGRILNHNDVNHTREAGMVPHMGEALVAKLCEALDLQAVAAALRTQSGIRIDQAHALRQRTRAVITATSTTPVPLNQQLVHRSPMNHTHDSQLNAWERAAIACTQAEALCEQSARLADQTGRLYAQTQRLHQEVQQRRAQRLWPATVSQEPAPDGLREREVG